MWENGWDWEKSYCTGWPRHWSTNNYMFSCVYTSGFEFLDHGLIGVILKARTSEKNHEKWGVVPKQGLKKWRMTQHKSYGGRGGQDDWGRKAWERVWVREEGEFSAKAKDMWKVSIKTYAVILLPQTAFYWGNVHSRKNFHPRSLKLLNEIPGAGVGFCLLSCWLWWPKRPQNIKGYYRCVWILNYK